MVTHPAHGATQRNARQRAARARQGIASGRRAARRPGASPRSRHLGSARRRKTRRQRWTALRPRDESSAHHARISRRWSAAYRKMPRGTIDGPIGRDPRNRLKFTIASDGQPAVTHYTRARSVSEALPSSSLRLETGRTHQIRVHLAAAGHPIINDPLYGKQDPRFELPGQALHAWRLAFPTSAHGRDVEFEVAASARVLAGAAISIAFDLRSISARRPRSAGTIAPRARRTSRRHASCRSEPRRRSKA